MKYRPLDENGDMVPIHSTDQMLTGVSAVAQAAKTRLQFFAGEWWEDETIGFELPTYLLNSLRVSEMDLAARYVSQYIAETPGVNSIDNVQYVYDKHNMIFGCSILAGGEREEVEVNVDGVR